MTKTAFATPLLIVVVSAFLVTPLASPAASVPEQSPTTRLERLSVADVDLWIGMTKEEANKALSKCCRELTPEDGAFVASKDGKKIFGAVWFKNGIVSEIRRDEFGSSEAETTQFALRLFRLASEFGNSGAPVIATTRTVEATNATLRTLDFKFADGRTIQVWHSQHDAGSAYAEIKVSR